MKTLYKKGWVTLSVPSTRLEWTWALLYAASLISYMMGKTDLAWELLQTGLLFEILVVVQNERG